MNILPVALFSLPRNFTASFQDTISAGASGFCTELGLLPITAVHRACETGLELMTNPPRATS